MKFFKLEWLLFIFIGSILTLFLKKLFTFEHQKEHKQSIEETINKVLNAEGLPISNSLPKINFEDNIYIYLVNKWNYAGNAFIHDPGCICQKK